MLLLRMRAGRPEHTSAYVSIRQHASAHVSIRQHTADLSAPKCASIKCVSFCTFVLVNASVLVRCHQEILLSRVAYLSGVSADANVCADGNVCAGADARPEADLTKQNKALCSICLLYR